MMLLLSNLCARLAESLTRLSVRLYPRYDAFVCRWCRDSHWISVPCKQCPYPCEECCDKDKGGCFCETTPCGCHCHTDGVLCTTVPCTCRNPNDEPQE